MCEICAKLKKMTPERHVATRTERIYPPNFKHLCIFKCCQEDFDIDSLDPTDSVKYITVTIDGILLYFSGEKLVCIMFKQIKVRHFSPMKSFNRFWNFRYFRKKMHVHFCIQLFSFLQQCQQCQQFSRWRRKFPLPPQTLYCTYIIVKLSLFTFNTDNTFRKKN